eukprot:XP_011613131.1 PREDICTED: amino-terminal enhancer of split-like [Takifugu rubripes]
MMFPQSRHSASSQQLKFTTSDSCDRIKDEFQFLQAQYHSLKLECDKLASEKSEMQRHYIMYYEMSYGLNIEMHKQAEIVKRLNGICAQILPYLSQEVNTHTHTHTHTHTSLASDPQPYSSLPGMRSPSFVPHYLSTSVTPSLLIPPSSPLCDCDLHSTLNSKGKKGNNE